MIKSKLPNVGTSIFTVMSNLALENDAINLSQGFPDFPCSPQLIELVDKYMRKGYNQYAPMPGVPALREQIATKTVYYYNSYYDPQTEITITSGATEALFAAIATLVDQGDEVILFEPAYDSYAPAIQLNGGICKYIPLSLPDYTIDWDVVQKAISQKTKLLIINTPHNPTGSVISEEDVFQLAQIVDKTGIFVISDEVYEHIIFDNFTHHSLAKNLILREKSFVISSFGKTFHTTGWKVGYCLAPTALTKEFRKIHQYLTFSTSTPMQYAIAEFMEDKSNIESLSGFYQNKRDKFRSLISASRFNILPCLGTYFQLLDYRNISNERDDELAVRLTKEIRVASIPISAFYETKQDNKVLRFCFAKEDSTLEAAAERLCKI